MEKRKLYETVEDFNKEKLYLLVKINLTKANHKLVISTGEKSHA